MSQTEVEIDPELLTNVEWHYECAPWEDLIKKGQRAADYLQGSKCYTRHPSGIWLNYEIITVPVKDEDDRYLEVYCNRTSMRESWRRVYQWLSGPWWPDVLQVLKDACDQLEQVKRQEEDNRREEERQRKRKLQNYGKAYQGKPVSRHVRPRPKAEEGTLWSHVFNEDES